ncbi:hypothetical protein [Streptomyces sp. TS71-3]|uniref:hypothetical protein n=1 Tax=Streptomyces sp. TS71-3 TaxID=2733862 RepID=UPI001B2285EB|nr:hypothetical protein [Streptomyces sp. TS71-3]GHJ40663.1 hypothetical protein Sm713_62720 [Streptomyces sp. TS71-3]
MKSFILRWLLDPLTSLLAPCLWFRERGRWPYDAAWRLARVMHQPDKLVYRIHGHRPDDPKA